MVFDRLLGADDDATMEPEPDEDVASIRRAISELGLLSTEQRRFLAGYAYILVRVARADGVLDDREIARMEQAVSAAGDLPQRQGVLLVALASKMNSLYGMTEDYAVTREFARSSSPQQVQRLLRACVAVSTADGPFTTKEVTELHEVGRELGLSADEVNAISEQVSPRPVEPTDPQAQAPSQ